MFNCLIDGMAEKRKAAIEYFYLNIYGSPDDIDSIVAPIMNDLHILRGDYNRVKDVLQDLKQKTENPDVIGKKDGRGRKPLIEDFNDEAKLIYGGSGATGTRPRACTRTSTGKSTGRYHWRGLRA